ncbi:MAG: response regulator transcription factor [Verrucomicrobiota bacterium]
MQREVRLIIVDDHPVFRRGLREIVEENSRFRIVGEAADGEQALRLMEELKPEIAIVDVDMPRLNGLKVVRAMKERKLPVTVVFLTMYSEEDVFRAAMGLGVNGYILKENAADEVVAALEKVLKGETFVSASMAGIHSRREDRVQPLPLSPQLETLTSAERHILKLVSEDRTSKEIAEQLQISIRTVEKHRLNICGKLNLRGSHVLLKFAYDHKAYL